MENKYDIFISYRRDGGAQYARILQLMLQQRGYRVFLDYDELTDGIFSDHIRQAIKDAPVFMLVLSQQALARCVNADDWVRQEIQLAAQQGKHFVPVNPDGKFDGVPDGVPDDIRAIASSHQHSEIGFGQTLGVTIDLMIKNRIAPHVGERTATGHVDTDFDAARETLRRTEAHRRFMKRLAVGATALVVAIVAVACLLFWRHQQARESEADQAAALDALRTELQARHAALGLYFSPDMTEAQMRAVDTLLTAMVEVRHDTLWLCQYECSEGLWADVQGEPCDAARRQLPKTGVSYGDIYLFLGRLADMTNIPLQLPSADDWLYAARGGVYAEATRYAGSDDADAVAWHDTNAGGTLHPSDGQQGLLPNHLDLFDMSGNAAELCNSHYAIDGDNVLYTLCGGSFRSPASGVAVTARSGVSTDARADTIGFRIAIVRQ